MNLQTKCILLSRFVFLSELIMKYILFVITCIDNNSRVAFYFMKLTFFTFNNNECNEFFSLI